MSMPRPNQDQLLNGDGHSRRGDSFRTRRTRFRRKHSRGGGFLRGTGSEFRLIVDEDDFQALIFVQIGRRDR